jgi:hypothetical protein
MILEDRGKSKRKAQVEWPGLLGVIAASMYCKSGFGAKLGEGLGSNVGKGLFTGGNQVGGPKFDY